MMRGATNWSVAVRKPNGAIAQVQRPIESAMAKHRLLRLPIIRGVVALGESLAIGFRALAISANYAAQEETAADDEEPSTELSRGALGIESVLVTEDDLKDGFRFVYGRMKLACEVAGAATAAALLAGKVELEPHSRVAAVVSGGNVAPEAAVAILAER